MVLLFVLLLTVKVESVEHVDDGDAVQVGKIVKVDGKVEEEDIGSKMGEELGLSPLMRRPTSFL